MAHDNADSSRTGKIPGQGLGEECACAGLEAASNPSSGVGAEVDGVETVLAAVARATSTSTGQAFFQSLTQGLAESLAVRYAFVAELVGPGLERARTLAVWAQGAPAANFEYALAGTPCAEVTSTGVCLYPAGVQRAFPQDDLLRQMGVESYHGTPLRDGSGRPMGLLVVLDSGPMSDRHRRLRSILEIFAARAAAELERMRIEQALRASEERYAAAQQAANVGTWDRDLLSDRLVWSAQVEPMFGLPPGGFPGTYSAFLRFVHPNDLEAVVEAGRRAVRGGGDYLIEHRVVWPNGMVRWVAEHGAVQRDASGRAVRMLGVVQDVTRRHLAEEDRFRLAVAVEQAAEGVLVTDAVGVVQYANPALLRITGLLLPEVVGHPAWECGSALTREQVALAQRPSHHVEDCTRRFSRRRPDDSVYDVEEVVSPLREPGGRINGFISVQRDITEHLALEEQLRQAQKMQAIGQLAGGVAHDFNNLLQAILGNLQLVRGDLGAAHPAQEALGEVEQASRRAMELVRQLLLFGRRQPLRSQSVELHQALSEFVRMVRRMIGENIELVVEQAGPIQPVLADPGQLQQVLMNLCLNARDAMPHGGRITLSTGRERLDAAFCATHPWAQPGQFTRLSVRDNGVGMPPAVQARVFEPFFTTKEVGRGSGLGLATVYGIVRQHGGLITFESKPAGGTVFHLYFPEVRSAGVEHPPAPVLPSVPATGSGECVLLVEDEEAVRRLATRVLERGGYSVLVAADGEEGLQVFAAHQSRIHLALIDLVMPRKGGVAVAEAVRAARPGLPVLFVSGYDRDRLAGGLQLDSCTGYLQKPYMADELLEKVRLLLDRRAP